MLANLFRRSPTAEQTAAKALHEAVVAQARNPVFFADLGVPDSVFGRYELIMLHGAVVVNRLKDRGDKADAVAQAFFDALFVDVDDNLRELGVSDLRVGTRVKKMAQAFHGRAVAFEEALNAPGTDDLEGVISRNTYSSGEPTAEQVKAMADYLRAVTERLALQPLDGFLAGTVDFGPVPEVADATEAGGR